MKKPVEDWLFLAQCDIDAAELIVSEEHLTGIAAFLCQQAAEKYFKAILLEKGLPVLKIYNLAKLYTEVK
jgi:HEPN domain-containing protein